MCSSVDVGCTIRKVMKRGDLELVRSQDVESIVSASWLVKMMLIQSTRGSFHYFGWSPSLEVV